LRRIRGGSFEIRRQLCSNSWFHQEIPDLRRSSQLVLKITQEVKLLLTYINRLYDGGKGDLIRIEVMKLMILEETHSQPKESDQ
jgi:hypothetical protein